MKPFGCAMLRPSLMCRRACCLRPLAYTTVLTILDRLSRRAPYSVKQGKAYVTHLHFHSELSRQEA
jgi:hypothetical protein